MNDKNLPIKATPYKHQVEAFEFAIKRGSTALLMEMGTGKSLTSIAVTGRLYLDCKIKRVLIVAPLSIVGVWEEEFANFDYTLAILNGTVTKKADTLRHMTGSPLQVIICNYESAWRLEREILAWKPDFIIADEAHKIKSHTAKSSKFMHKLGGKTQYKLLLTGTVITNKALDVFSQYKYADSAIFGQSYYVFRNRYFNVSGQYNEKVVLKTSMESEFTAKLHSIAYRATKAECLDLPETTDILRYVELEASAAKIYRDLVKDSYSELSKGEITTTNILTRLLRLSQLTGGFIGDDEGNTPQNISTAKLDALSDIIEDVTESGQKLVIIARFVAEIKAICSILQKKNLRYSLIMGGVKDRAEQVSQFQTNPNVKVFIGQIATAGLGITLTAASTMVFYSLDYSMSNFEQAKARIHRVGQKQQCTYIYLTAKNTVDEKILKALSDKADLAKTLIDDCRNGKNPFM